jgi:restriction system protein
VKTSEADGSTLRDLQGTMQNFGADYGLLVAWRGLKKGVRSEARRSFFKMRLWDAGDVVEQLTAVYDRLPADVRDDLPLTQIWTVVGGEEGSP